MSDLTATNCGCANSNSGCNNGLFGGSCSWIILLLLFCGGNGFGGNGCGSGLFGRNSDGCGSDCCEWLIWILLLSSFCGNNSNNGCSSSCC